MHAICIVHLHLRIWACRHPHRAAQAAQTKLEMEDLREKIAGFKPSNPASCDALLIGVLGDFRDRWTVAGKPAEDQLHAQTTLANIMRDERFFQWELYRAMTTQRPDAKLNEEDKLHFLKIVNNLVLEVPHPMLGASERIDMVFSSDGTRVASGNFDAVIELKEKASDNSPKSIREQLLRSACLQYNGCTPLAYFVWIGQPAAMRKVMEIGFQGTGCSPNASEQLHILDGSEAVGTNFPKRPSWFKTSRKGHGSTSNGGNWGEFAYIVWEVTTWWMDGTNSKRPVTSFEAMCKKLPRSYKLFSAENKAQQIPEFPMMKKKHSR